MHKALAHNRKVGEQMNYTFEIPGEPCAKQRPRVVHTKQGNTHSYTPEKTVQYENHVKTIFQQKYGSPMLDGPLLVEIAAYFGLLKRDYGKTGLNKQGREKLAGIIRPVKKPDADNIAKAVLDSLNQIAYRDDSQVVDIHAKKLYAEAPCVRVSIRTVQKSTAQEGNL